MFCSTGNDDIAPRQVDWIFKGDLKFLSTYVAGCTSLDITLIYNRNGIGMQIIQLLLLYTERKPWNLDVKQTSINNEYLGITNDILRPSNAVEKNLDTTKPGRW